MVEGRKGGRRRATCVGMEDRGFGCGDSARTTEGKIDMICVMMFL